MTNRLSISFSVCFLALTLSASAQWKTTTYTLKGGWNSIYLHGDASHATPDVLFATGGGANIEEVWRWNPNPTQVQFTADPLIPAPGTPEWSTWYRGNPGASSLSAMVGQTGYLIKCAGTAANTYSVQIKHRPQPPSSTWVRNGANLLGFPSNAASPPTMNAYFATFPAAVAANNKIFKYVGGDLGPANPLQVFSPSFESLGRNQAYWFEAEVTGSFYAPIEVAPSDPDGLEFGRTRAILAVRLRNRTASPVTITISPENSDAAPAGETGVTGPVPLTRRTFDTGSSQYVETPISGAFNEVIGPQSSIEIEFGINRGALSANPADFYASFLKFTDSSNLMEILIPASAQPSTLSGLWVGDATVTNVVSEAVTRARATATVTGGEVTGLTLESGGLGYASAPTITFSSSSTGNDAQASAIVQDGSVTEIAITNGGAGYESVPTVTFSEPAPLTGSGVLRSFPLRYIMHIDDAGTARLLSQVHVGVLDTDDFGLAVFEGKLKTDAIASASRMVATHLPLDYVAAGSGSVGLGSSVDWTVALPFDDKVNPFVHQYHPDHDNIDPRGDALANGVESHDVGRALSFDFLATPPAGTSATGWGTTVLGGNYSEIVTGIHKDPITSSGTFIFRRVNDLGSIDLNP